MSDYQPLNDEEVNAIAQEYFEHYKRKATPQQQPTMVIVGGQSGAGKTGAAYFAKSQLKKIGGYIHIDADRMRERITTDKAYPSHITQPDAGKLANTVRNLAMNSRLNVLEEGTLKDPVSTASWVEKTKEKGYRVQLMAQATPYELSKANIYKRHEYQHGTGNHNPRMVPMPVHEQGYQGFAVTVKNYHIFDHVQIRNHEGDILFDSNNLNNSQYPDPQQALQAGRTLTPNRHAIAKDNIQVALRIAQNRNGVEEDYLQHLKQVADAI